MTKQTITKLFRLSLVCLAVAPAHSARAQAPYTLVASVIAGGGGDTSVGDYVLGGTIGQWDVGTTSGGPREIAGGFWNTEPLPWLRIQRSGGSVLIAWPAPFAGFQLEESVALGLGAAWGNISQSINVVNGENQVTLAIGAGTRFFRLRKP